MNHTLTRKTGQLFAAIMGLVLAAALMPGLALAAPFDEDGGSLTVNGLKSGDVVDIYQVVDTDYDATTNNLTSAFAGSYGVDFDTYAASASDPTGLSEMANTIATAVVVNGATTASHHTATATGDSVSFSNLNAGQYLVVVTTDDSTRVFQNTIASVEPIVETGAGGVGEYVWPATNAITLKSTDLTEPDPDDPSQTGELNKMVGAFNDTDFLSAGDVANFTITSLLPRYAQNATDRVYTVQDTLSSNLAYGNDLVVSIGGTTLSAGTDYTVSTPSGATFAVTLSNATLLAHGGQRLTITYSATVGTGAVHGTAETNTAKLTFSDRSYGTTTKEQSDTAHVTTYQITFNKVDATDSSKKLAGAEFDVFKSDGTKVGHVVTDSSGVGSFEPLGQGSYYLVETVAPAGYDIDTTQHPFTVASDVQSDFSGTVQAISDITNGRNATLTLPVTGGPGTIALTALGLALMVAAAVLILRSRRTAGRS